MKEVKYIFFLKSGVSFFENLARSNGLKQLRVEETGGNSWTTVFFYWV